MTSTAAKEYFSIFLPILRKNIFICLSCYIHTHTYIYIHTHTHCLFVGCWKAKQEKTEGTPSPLGTGGFGARVSFPFKVSFLQSPRNVGKLLELLLLLVPLQVTTIWTRPLCMHGHLVASQPSQGNYWVDLTLRSTWTDFCQFVKMKNKGYML